MRLRNGKTPKSNQN